MYFCGNYVHHPKCCGQVPLHTGVLTLISGFRCDVDEICSLLGNYAASCGNCLQTLWDNVSVPASWVKSSFLLGLLTHEDGTDTSSRNVGKQLPHDAALYPRRSQISSATPLFFENTKAQTLGKTLLKFPVIFPKLQQAMSGWQFKLVHTCFLHIHALCLERTILRLLVQLLFHRGSNEALCKYK